MPTLVKCLTYSDKISEILMGARQKTDFRINASPQEVLQGTLPNYFLKSYLETYPWMVTIKPGRDYVAISEIDDSSRLHGNLGDFLKCEDFFSAKREHKLNTEESENLAKKILETLSIDNYPGIMVSKSPQAYIAYSHVLNALGHNIIPEQVSEMISAQQQKWYNEILTEQMRRARDFNELANKIVGAEG